MEIRIQRPDERMARCPFCFGSVEPGQKAWACQGCGTAHHVECAHEHGLCTVHGCGSVVPRDVVASRRHDARRARENEPKVVLFAFASVLSLVSGAVALWALPSVRLSYFNYCGGML